MAKKQPGRLDEIIENARKARAEEFGDEPIERDVDPVEADEEDIEPANEEENENYREQNDENGNYTGEGEEESEDEPDEPEGDEEEDLVTIVVDGEQRRVPRSKVYEQGIRTLQKEAAADKRLAEANQRVREAQEYETRMKAQIEAQLRASQERSQDAPLSSKQDADIKQRARQLVNKILDGDEEEAANVLAEFMGRQSTTPQLDTDQIVSQVSAKVQRNAELKSAVAEFRKTYPRINDDPYLWGRADVESDRVQSEHPDWSPTEILLEAGRRVEDWLQSLAGPADPSSNPQHREGKRDKKRTTETLRQASARAPRPVEKRPPSRSEVVEMMRKNRGLPV